VYRRRQVLLTLALGAAILASGIAIGAGGSILLLGDRRREEGFRRPLAAAIARDVAARCGLNPQQTERVKQILSDRSEALWDIRQEMSRQVEAELEVLDGQMREVLRPDQYQKWRRRFNAARRHGRGRRDFPPGGQGPGRGGRCPRRGEPGQARRAGMAGRGLGREGMMRRFDLDGDGRLVRDEVPPRLWRRLSRHDADGDGAVTAGELRAAGVPAPPQSAPGAR